MIISYELFFAESVTWGTEDRSIAKLSTSTRWGKVTAPCKLQQVTGKNIVINQLQTTPIPADTMPSSPVNPRRRLLLGLRSRRAGQNTPILITGHRRALICHRELCVHAAAGGRRGAHAEVPRRRQEVHQRLQHRLLQAVRLVGARRRYWLTTLAERCRRGRAWAGRGGGGGGREARDAQWHRRQFTEATLVTSQTSHSGASTR